MSFLPNELKSKNTVINLLLENVIKYKDEIRNIHSNHDMGNIQPKKTQKQRNQLKKRTINHITRTFKYDS